MEPGLSIRPQTELDNIVSVLLPLPLTASYDYIVPKNISVVRGSYVQVPLGARSVIGVVWGSARGDVETQKLREISVLLDLPPMPKNLILFIEWVAGYTLARLGNVLRMTMSVPQALQPPKKITIYDLVPGVMEKSESLLLPDQQTPPRKKCIGQPRPRDRRPRVRRRSGAPTTLPSYHYPAGYSPAHRRHLGAPE